MERMSQGSVSERLLRGARQRQEVAALLLIPALRLAQWLLVRALHVVAGPAAWARQRSGPGVGGAVEQRLRAGRSDGDRGLGRGRRRGRHRPGSRRLGRCTLLLAGAVAWLVLCKAA